MHTPSLFSGNPRLILASSSTYRQALLKRLCLPFEVMVPGVKEAALPNEVPAATAARLAKDKALCVALNKPGALVIGSDQVATCENLAIGKPGSHANALAQLQAMRGKTVIFHTAVCLIDTRPVVGRLENLQQHAVVDTIVKFRDLDDAALDAYLHVEKPYDCAGSAKNEGLGIALIESCSSSDPTALTGLPLIALCGMLYNVGIEFFTGMKQ